jgi:hypothetical protein
LNANGVRGRQASAPRSYMGELTSNWRPLGSACLGMSSGYLINHYIANTFAPDLLREFGWSKAHFALLGTLGLLIPKPVESDSLGLSGIGVS